MLVIQEMLVAMLEDMVELHMEDKQVRLNWYQVDIVELKSEESVLELEVELALVVVSVED